MNGSLSDDFLVQPGVHQRQTVKKLKMAFSSVRARNVRKEEKLPNEVCRESVARFSASFAGVGRDVVVLQIE